MNARRSIHPLPRSRARHRPPAVIHRDRAPAGLLGWFQQVLRAPRR